MEAFRVHPPVQDDQISVDFPSKANHLLSLKELVEVGCYWEDPRPDSTVRVRETRHALSPVFVRPLTGRGGSFASRGFTNACHCRKGRSTRIVCFGTLNCSVCDYSAPSAEKGSAPETSCNLQAVLNFWHRLTFQRKCSLALSTLSTSQWVSI